MSRGGAYLDASGRGRFTIGEVMRERSAQDLLFPGTYAASTGADAVREELDHVRHAYEDEILDLVVTRNIKDFVARADDYRALKEEGVTRYIGVARHQQQYHQTMIDLMDAGAVDFVQVNYSMLEPEAEQRLLPMAQEKGVAVLINRPFINGQFFSIVRGHELPAWAAEFDCESWAQFSLKFILSHPAVNCVLTETANPKHAIDNLGAGIGRLPDLGTRQKMFELIEGLA
jgi:diketogulonate reductase-like aldo/keto reductase